MSNKTHDTAAVEGGERWSVKRRRGRCNFWRNIVAARVICVDGPHLASWACVVYLRNNKLAGDRSVPEATLLRGMFATSLKRYY